MDLNFTPEEEAQRMGNEDFMRWPNIPHQQ